MIRRSKDENLSPKGVKKQETENNISDTGGMVRRSRKNMSLKRKR